LIDDLSHAQLLLDSLLKRNLGYYGLVERLRRDGIAAELARQLVSERLAEDVEAQHARQLIDRLAAKWESLPARQRSHCLPGSGTARSMTTCGAGASGTT